MARTLATEDGGWSDLHFVPRSKFRFYVADTETRCWAYEAKFNPSFPREVKVSYDYLINQEVCNDLVVRGFKGCKLIKCDVVDTVLAESQPLLVTELPMAEEDGLTLTLVLEHPVEWTTNS